MMEDEITKRVRKVGKALSDKVRKCSDAELIKELGLIKIKGNNTYTDVLFSEALARILKKDEKD